MLLVDSTQYWGLSIVVRRAIELPEEKWVLHASFSDVELHRTRKRVDVASTPSIVGAISLILAVDGERMLRRVRELPDGWGRVVEVRDAGN